MCIGTGWIAGRSAVEDLEAIAPSELDPAEVRALHDESFAPRNDAAEAASDQLLKNLQQLMFAYDVSVWKHASRLEKALARVGELKHDLERLQAPHTHELVRLKETEAMVLAAELILRASLHRTESRMSHFREDFDFRDDRNWLCWVDVRDDSGAPRLSNTPIPLPLVSPGAGEPAAVKRVVRGAG
jgi:succinate dehydrogenase/fumarate reductase flavoprotein subunit